MVQLARPVSDDSNNGWTPKTGTSLYNQINEEVPNDATFYVYTGPNPQGSTFQVKLQPLAYPSSGQETLTGRINQMGTGTTFVTILLLQGSSMIAGMSVLPTATFSDYVLTLSPSQVAQITNYADLHVNVSAGPGITTGCCPSNPLPSVLHLTFSNAPAWINGVSLPMFQNTQAQQPTWMALLANLCSMTQTNWLTLSCLANNTWWMAPITTGSCIALMGFPPTPSSVSCSPFSLVWNNVPLDASCGGPATCTLTVTF